MAGRTPQSAIRNLRLERLVSALLDWFVVNARNLPWRRTDDSYAIWVSEIMLQQTQVKTVIPYWEQWMRELPTITAVAKASPDKIHKLWEGLGYYTRARNLQKAARVIVKEQHGRFPDSFDDALALPGIGRYTAGAICSIAFNQPKPVLDGNVIRVLTRIFGIGENPREKETNAQLWQLAAELVSLAKTQRPQRKKHSHNLARVAPRRENNSCSFFNQSLMELGAVVCTPRRPQCSICPVKKLCVAFRENRVGELPNHGKRPASTARRFLAFAVESRGRFLVRQRPAGGLNAHLWEFPNTEAGARLSEPQRLRTPAGAVKIFAPHGKRACCGSGDPRSKSVADAAAQVLGFPPERLTLLCTVKHSITRYRLTLEAYHVKTGQGDVLPRRTGRWVTLAGLQRLALAGAHRKILRQLNPRV